MLKNITHLSLNDISLIRLPNDIGDLTNLVSLEVRDNMLHNLPPSMLTLPKLERLDLGNNEISILPEQLVLPSLQELWLDGNQLASLPSSICNLAKLSCVDLSENQLTTLPNKIGKLVNLTDLDASKNELIDIPSSIGELKDLTILKLEQNKLTTLTEDIGNCKNLQELVLTENSLTQVPASIGHLKQLNTLNIDRNKLSELPTQIGDCIRLTVLSTRENELTKLPENIGSLKNLLVLNLSGNKIKNLPMSIAKLTLKALWLSENQNQPMLNLQTDIDEATGSKVLTCYLLPQSNYYPTNFDTENNHDNPSSNHDKFMERNIKNINLNESLRSSVFSAGTDENDQKSFPPKTTFNLTPKKDENSSLLNNSTEDSGKVRNSIVKFQESDYDSEYEDKKSFFKRHDTPHPKEFKSRHPRLFFGKKLQQKESSKSADSQVKNKRKEDKELKIQARKLNAEFEGNQIPNNVNKEYIKPHPVPKTAVDVNTSNRFLTEEDLIKENSLVRNADPAKWSQASITSSSSSTNSSSPRLLNPHNPSPQNVKKQTKNDKMSPNSKFVAFSNLSSTQSRDLTDGDKMVYEEGEPVLKRIDTPHPLKNKRVNVPLNLEGGDNLKIKQRDKVIEKIIDSERPFIGCPDVQQLVEKINIEDRLAFLNPYQISETEKETLKRNSVREGSQLKEIFHKDFDVVHNNALRFVIDREDITLNGFGLSIAGGIGSAPYRDDDQGVFISRVTIDGPAYKAGLRTGDKIIKVNNSDFTVGISHANAVETLKTCDKSLPLTLYVVRSIASESILPKDIVVKNPPIPPKPLSLPLNNNLILTPTSTTNISNISQKSQHSPLDSIKTSMPSKINTPSIFNRISPSRHNKNKKLIHVSLLKTKTGLGFSIAGGKMHPTATASILQALHETNQDIITDDQPIYISDIVPGGVADNSKQLKIGDQIVTINGIDMMDARHDQAVTLLTASFSPIVRLTISRDLDGISEPNLGNHMDHGLNNPSKINRILSEERYMLNHGSHK
ncbi:unnamed protein product [Gordionus sp. m RMFG-2023]